MVLSHEPGAERIASISCEALELISSIGRGNWPPVGIQDHQQIAHYSPSCSGPFQSNGIFWSESLMQQYYYNFWGIPASMETTTYPGRLVPFVAFSSHGQINWPPIGVSNHDQNEYFQRIYNFYHSQPPMDVSSTDRVQQSTYNFSFDRAQFLSEDGTFSMLPGTDLSPIILHDESRTMKNEPSAFLPSKAKNNARDTKPSRVPNSESNTLSKQDSSSESNTEGKPGPGQENVKKYSIKTGEELFQCNICWQKFSCASDLKRHCGINGSCGRLIICNKCSRGFLHRNHLENHVCTPS